MKTSQICSKPGPRTVQQPAQLPIPAKLGTNALYSCRERATRGPLCVLCVRCTAAGPLLRATVCHGACVDDVRGRSGARRREACVPAAPSSMHRLMDVVHLGARSDSGSVVNVGASGLRSRSWCRMRTQYNCARDALLAQQHASAVLMG